jgi:hypothetical protein
MSRNVIVVAKSGTSVTVTVTGPAGDGVTITITPAITGSPSMGTFGTGGQYTATFTGIADGNYTVTATDTTKSKDLGTAPFTIP